ncbi:hypothetical protein K438DRAFT_1947510 [Mycena galopus ATCC 62051]|nr:hypothetical protein K438DRAFT_1947510 [Mycena galopus ATCC 62051]
MLLVRSAQRIVSCSIIPYRGISRRCYSVSPKDGDNKCGRPRRTISTLNSALLLPSDRLDLSGRKSVSVSFPKSAKDTEGTFSYETPNPEEVTPFPPQSTGFLHYHRDRDAAPLEGSIRFRVTSQRAPLSLHDGYDLLLPSGLPWRITLPQVAYRTNSTTIRDQLLEENLATPEELSQCRDLFGSRRRIRPEYTLFRLNQEFPVKFSGWLQLTVVGKTTHMLQLNGMFDNSREGSRSCFPWAGSGLACFVPSISAAHDGRRLVHLRITKIIDPVSSTGKEEGGKVLKPEAGNLLSHSRYELRPPSVLCGTIRRFHSSPLCAPE